MLASDVPKFRSYLFAPTGVPLLIQHIKGLGTADPPIPMLDVCGALAGVSCHPWCLASVALDICETLINLLMCVPIATMFAGYYLMFVQH